MKTFFAIVCLALGVMLFAEGYRANQKGRILPAIVGQCRELTRCSLAQFVLLLELDGHG